MQLKTLITSPEHHFDVARLDVRTDEIKLYWKAPNGRLYGSLSRLHRDLQAHGQRLLLATNAGIFEPGQIPTGLTVQRGAVRVPLNTHSGDGNFFLQPNGVFFLDARGAHVVSTTDFARGNFRPTEATQSGPLLVGNNRINTNFALASQNKKIRSGIGVTSDQTVYLVLSRTPVSFYDFADLFKTRLHCPNALYLDGGISKFYCPDRRRYDDGDFAGMIAILARLR